MVESLVATPKAASRVGGISALIPKSLRRPCLLEVAGSALAALLVLLPELDKAVQSGPVTLTPGRLLLTVAALAVFADLARHRTLSILKQPLVITLLVGVLAAVGLVLISVRTNGVNVRGNAAGLIEFAATVVLATYVLARDGRWTLRLLGAAGVGATLAAVLSVPELRSGLHTRIAGPYGNPNNLAIVLACGVPIATAAALHAQQRTRVLLSAVALLLVLGTFFTYSREALLSLGVALMVFAALRASVLRTRLLIAVAAVVLAGFGAALYPSFERSRLQADLGSQRYVSHLASHLSGAQAEAVGWIRGGGARVTGSRGALDVFAHAGREGTSLGLGVAKAGVPLVFSVRVRSLGAPVSVSLAMRDEHLATAAARRTLELTPAWKRYTLAWTPALPSDSPRVFLFTNAAGAFRFDSPTVRQGRSGTARRLGIAVASGEELRAAGQTDESADIHFREQMLSLAWRAFIHHPLRGIGWERFPAYADAHSVYGHQGAQSEYGRYLAELGIGGVIVLLVIAVAALLGLRRRSPTRDVVASVLTVWSLGLMFDNALETIPMSAILALGLAIACVRPHHLAARSIDVGPSRRPVGMTAAPVRGPRPPGLDDVPGVTVGGVYRLRAQVIST